jgi:hypothetical protein
VVFLIILVALSQFHSNFLHFHQQLEAFQIFLIKSFQNVQLPIRGFIVVPDRNLIFRNLQDLQSFENSIVFKYFEKVFGNLQLQQQQQQYLSLN